MWYPIQQAVQMMIKKQDFPSIEFAQQIILMAEQDQKMRFASQDKKTDFDISVDQRNTNHLKEIIKDVGWPTISLVGEEASYAAWLIAQHADHDIQFQQYCLNLMLKAKDGDVLPSNIAYLTDRVAVNRGKPQIYGTQFTGSNSKELIYRPIRDMDQLEERRKTMGLEPFAVYQQKMKSEYQ